MAIVKDPFLSGKARGSIGGITATIGIGGPVMKTKPIPVRRVRSTQPRNRSILGFLSREWGTLTDVERQAWRDYAVDNPRTNPFGDSFIMSGINAYTSLNATILRLDGAGSENDLPPAAESPASIESFIATTAPIVVGRCDLDWTHYGSPALPDINEIQIAGPFQSQGKVEVLSKFAYLDQTNGITITAVANGLLVGFWYWFRVRYVDQYGQVTAWLYSQATPKA